MALEFGLGAFGSSDTVTVSRPSSHIDIFVGVPADQRITLNELGAVDVGQSPVPGPAFQLAVATPNPASGPALLREAGSARAHHDTEARRAPLRPSGRPRPCILRPAPVLTRDHGMGSAP
jgi:hypothetical protein